MRRKQGFKKKRGRNWKKGRTKAKDRAASASKNASKIRRNKRAIAKLSRDTRESFFRQNNLAFVLHKPASVYPLHDAGTPTTPVPGPFPSGGAGGVAPSDPRRLGVGIVPIMPLLQADPTAAPGAQSWGVQGNVFQYTPTWDETGAPQQSWTFNGGGNIDSGIPIWPVSQSVDNLDAASKLRHNGTTLRYRIQMENMWAGAEEEWRRPAACRVWMVVMSAQPKVADALLRDRGMMPSQYSALPADHNEPDNPRPNPLVAGVDFIYGVGLYNKPEINRKLWKIHSTRTMDFGYRTAVEESGPEVHAAMIEQDDGLATSSNWYKEGSLKFPAYGKMYDMQPGARSDGGAFLTEPVSMDRNDLSNEKQRFIVFFTDGNYAPGPNSCQLRFTCSTRASYTISAGSML